MSAALREPDRSVTGAEVLAAAGPEFRTVMHKAGRSVGLAAERVEVRVEGPYRTYAWRAPAYASRHALLTAMVEQADRPKNAATTAVHRDVVTTAELAASLRTGPDQRLNHAVAVARAAVLPERDLPFPPYALGAWLGDGTSRAAQITTADPEIAEQIEAEGLRVVASPTVPLRYGIRLPQRPAAAPRRCVVCGQRFTPQAPQVRTCGRVCGARSRSIGREAKPAPAQRPQCPDCGRPRTTHGLCQTCRAHHGTAQAILRSMGVLGNKHIPAEYLRASEAQRRALLAGLLDTDGYALPGGTVQFAVTSQRLARGVLELVLSLGYRASMTTKPVRGRTPGSSTSYIITFTPDREVFRLRRKAVRQTAGLKTARSRYVTDVRPVPSVPVRCVQVDSPDHMYLASRSWIPTHNSTLALDLARAATVKHGLPCVIFSLEMGRNEITMRLLSAEARVPLHSMRTGQMSDEDWTRLARRMSEVVEAPLYIDDSPNMSMMEIRAKCRRLKQRHDLKLVIIDYLQLMSSPKRVENRQQEVSEMSRSLKLLAKELDVPVIAVAQLNRGPEQRTDKKPLLSDLRESGCLTAATRILRADTGSEVTLGELLASGARNVPVWSLDERLHLVPRVLTHAFPSGVKEVFQVRLRSGREVQATANHPFLTYDGWLPLGELHPGTRVAVPRHVPAPLAPAELPEPEIILLAHLIGDGSFVRRQPLRYASTDEACLAAVTEAARHFGIVAVRDDYPAARCTTLRLPAPYRLTHGKRNPVAAWLDGLGLFGLRSHEKFVPEPVFSLPKRQVRLFLRHLWATDGCVWWDRGNGQARIYYGSTSRRLVDDVAQLLLRFGISARLKETAKAGYRTCYQLHVGAGEDQVPATTSCDSCARSACMVRAMPRPACAWPCCRQPRATPTSTPSPGRSGSGSVRCWPSGRCRTASSRPRWAPSTAAARCGRAHRAGSGSAGSRPYWTTRTSA